MIDSFQFISDYKDIPAYRQSFNHLAQVTFGIDFEKWYQAGFWNDRYICYSYLDGDKVVANVSVNLVDLIIDGVSHKGLQIGTVMTHPDYQGKGLSGQLMKAVLSKYEQEVDIIYLFANKTVLDFYPKYGFKVENESLFSLDVNEIQPSKVGIRKLDLSKSDDVTLIKSIAEGRVPTSQLFGVKNAHHILTWYAVNIFPNDIYYLEEEQSLIIFQNSGDNLHLYDVISRSQLKFNQIMNRIVTEDTKKIIFYFTPDFQDIQPISEQLFDSDDTLFVKTSLKEFPTTFKHPITAHA